MEFTHGMRVMRAMRRLSQVKLANASGLTLWTVSHAEAGRVNLNASEKSRIRIALVWPETIDPLLEKIQTAHYEA